MMTSKVQNWYVAVISVLNLYYFSLWIFVFNKYDTQEERVSAFLENWPLVKHLFVLNSVLFVLTFISVFVVLAVFKPKIRFLLVAIHILFLVFLAWAHL